MASYYVFTGRWQDVFPSGLISDHLISDPPYSRRVHSKSRAGSRKQPLTDGNGRLPRCAFSREVDFGFEHITVEDMEALADLASERVSRWSLVFCDSESMHLWGGAFSSAGLEHVRNGAWVKIGATPQFTGDRPGVGFEGIVIAHPKGRKRWNGGGKVGVWSALTVIERGGQRRENNSRVHPTQKPIDLMMELIADFTDPGDTILDPYCGSGTTLVAALRLGRNAIGCELNPEWAELARQRCEAELANSSLAAVRAGQLSLLGGT